jgi:hypothetical protein
MNYQLIVTIIFAIVLTLQNRYAALTRPGAQRILNATAIVCLVVWLLWSLNVLALIRGHN